MIDKEIIKSKAKYNEIENKKKSRKTIKTKVDKKINKIKIDKILARLSIKKRREKIQLTNISNERGDIPTDFKDIKKIKVGLL